MWVKPVDESIYMKKICCRCNQESEQLVGVQDKACLRGPGWNQDYHHIRDVCPSCLREDDKIDNTPIRSRLGFFEWMLENMAP